MTTTAPATSRRNQITMGDQLTPPYTINDYPSAAYSNPTSPQRSGFGSRQINTPRSPAYVPAVLRRTELPSRRPITPPRSLHSSTDSLSRASITKTATQPISIITTLTRTSTASSGPSTPTNSVQPSRAHWKPDASTMHCEAPGCCLAFSFMQRRHHCRRCGGIFCSSHAGATVPLNEEADIDETGSYHRACDSCFRDWDGYSQGLLSGRISKINGQRNGAKDIAGTGKKSADAAGSVPRDWSWSTF